MNLRIAVMLASALLLAACVSTVRSPLAQWSPSSNFEQRRAVLIVLHATEQESVERSLHTLKTANSGGPVSAHYLVGRSGSIHQLVGDEQRAWHAGGGSWGGITDINSVSIGIELDNDGEAEFSETQIVALLGLLDDLCTRLHIPRRQIIAHYDLAPTRKRDPNAHFPWKRLAQEGFGIWPDDAVTTAPEGFDPWLALVAFGYALDNPEATLRAFHRRFRGIEGDMPLDEEDRRILYALTRELLGPVKLVNKSGATEIHPARNTK